MSRPEHRRGAHALPGLEEARVECRDALQGLDYRPRDQVREADLACRTRPRELVVQDEPVDFEQFRRHHPEARRRRHREARGHVGDRPPLRYHAGVRRCPPKEQTARRLGHRPPPVVGIVGELRRHQGRTGEVCAAGFVPFEELGPALADAPRIPAELLEHVVHQPGVGTEIFGKGLSGVSHGEHQPTGIRPSDLGEKGPRRPQVVPWATDKCGVTSVTQLLRLSRAVVRLVEAGNDAVCEHCRAPIKFLARAKERQVIANVYVDGRWDRVEHYHDGCYQQTGEPYGPART